MYKDCVLKSAWNLQRPARYHSNCSTSTTLTHMLGFHMGGAFGDARARLQGRRAVAGAAPARAVLVVDARPGVVLYVSLHHTGAATVSVMLHYH